MTIEEYSSILDKFNISRHMCKCCGKEIIYYNTSIFITKNHKVNISGKSFRTIKVINGIEYHLMVCQQCLLKKFSNIKNLSRIFNVMCDATQFAFNIPQKISQSIKKKYALSEGLFIKKYGEEEGKRRWESYLEKQKITKSREYMINKYGENNVSKINKSKSVNLDNLIKKYGEEEGKRRWHEYIANRSKPYSQISQECFRKIDKFISSKYSSMFYSKNTEKFIMIDDRMIFLDYYIPELNICIEFNGDMWHGNPNIYQDHEHCNPFYTYLTAKDLQEKDYFRYKRLEELYGIHTYIIWESEYKSKNFDI